MNPPERRDEALPRRDWLLLPLVSLSVIAVLWGGATLVSGQMFGEAGAFSCGTPNGQKPNCVCRYKNAEGPEVEYRFNECGFRSTSSCGPKPRDAVRVVFMGTSSTMGLHVPENETFAARTEAALNGMCGRPVESQNMGSLAQLLSQPELVTKALELKPDVIVLALSPFDVQIRPAAVQAETKALSWPASVALAWHDFKLRMRDTRVAFAVAHLMLLDEQMLYRMYLTDGSSREVMEYPPSPAGERRFDELSSILDSMMAKLKGSGVPLVVMTLPNRVAAAMVSNRSKVEGTDALWFGRHVGELAVQHGALPLDATPEFSDVSHGERLFYPVDNHPTGAAHALIARALVKRLTDGAIPQLAACRTLKAGGPSHP